MTEPPIARSRRRRCAPASASRVWASISTATNSRIGLSKRQAQHIHRGLRRLKLDHLAAAEELERAHAGPAVHRYGNDNCAHGLFRRAARGTGNAGDADANVRL